MAHPRTSFAFGNLQRRWPPVLSRRSYIVAFALLLSVAVAQTPTELTLIGPTEPSERVTGVYCISVDQCLVTAEGRDFDGHLYATDGRSITTTLLTSDYALGEAFGVIGAVDLMGLSHVGDTLYVLIDGAADALLASPVAEATEPGSWTTGNLGSPEGRDSFGGNQQIGLGTDGTGWLLFTRNTIYTSDDPPGPGAIWYPEWAPVPPGEVPSDIGQRARDDPTLCIASPGLGISPALTQAGYVAADLSLVVYPAGARNQMGAAGPGVCVSTDGGTTFHHVRFPEVEGDLGPLGVTCKGVTCLAYGGLENEPGSTYVYVTHDAGAGAAASWTRAELPRLREDARFRAAALAPGASVGWVVGSVGASAPLALVTSDGGLTWTDESAVVRAHAPDTRLHTVFLYDETHVWIGGENGLLLSGGY